MTATNRRHRIRGTAERCIVSYLPLASLLFIVLAAASCSKRYQDLPAFSAFPIRDAENQSVGRFKTSYLADQIHAYFRGNVNGPIAVTTFVDIDNLYETSTFGRLLAEQMMSELTMRGYNVIELRQAEAMQIMFDRGEFGLSRDMATLKKHQDVSAIVVGTYTASPVRVYLNTRLIDPSSSLVASVGSVEMARTPEISRLLRTNSFPPTLERIPVRHLGYGRSPAPHYWPYYYGPAWAPDPQGFGNEEEAPLIQPRVPTPNLPPAHNTGAPSAALEPTS